ncbi:CocE/NonD family hydrolase [Undibacterium baiyunense]|uniref:CocE/NonD family hydrolase n=1 Tax=Undibacterium baiyunense TaxID=2828731 RepID=A0A941I2T5_9BURK|nr:CocE/NonD family hydrolase [Undibacterium baiyunense]MBR7747833.1 CocE/NonD family hydrolase [Undibacterium baiyunense]
MKQIKSSAIMVFIMLILQALIGVDAWSNESYLKPVSLAAARMEQRSDAYELLQSNLFRQELDDLVKRAMLTPDDASRDDDKIAIASFLGDFQQTHALIAKQKNPLGYFHYSSDAWLRQASSKPDQYDSQALMTLITTKLGAFSNEDLYKVSYCLGWSLEMGQDFMLSLFKRLQSSDMLKKSDIVRLVTNYQLYKVYERILGTGNQVLSVENDKRYVIEPNVLIKTKSGVSLSAVVVRPKQDAIKRPAAFQFSIYADEAWHIKTAIHAAAHGYIGVIANTRGKRLSPNEIIPWEKDGEDATQVIDWITQQSWSDGRVAMYGGSYLGFTQWAAAKYMHPALKTIVPYAAANPITGLPIENNIFITPNYQWAFHVTNNKTMDHSVYADRKYWDDVFENLYKSGRAFRDIDKVEGTPNPWFQKWLKHPDYDSYYQQMLPYKNDYKKINIPVLSITGYFDGGQISAIDFLKQHYQYNPKANHTLLIGPYSHGTAQGVPYSHHSNYQLDPVALEKDTEELTFQWFDYVLFNKPRPALLKDKVNYQLMGSNTWQHHSSLQKLNQEAQTFYLGTTQDQDGHYRLTSSKPSMLNSVAQTVDLADRSTTNNDAGMWPLIHKQLPKSNGLVFVTEPFTETMQLAGSITGHFSIAINKRDVDIGYNFYAISPEGEVTFLNYYISRASYAHDMSMRKLLTPGKKTQVPIVNARMTAKLLPPGSRLVIVLDVNKNSNAQVNMGTGKDVSDETSADGKEPLEIKWFSDSKIVIPLKPWRLK